VRQRVRRVVQRLSDEPRPSGSILMNAPAESRLEVRRLRLDEWRVIYVIDEEWSELGGLAVRKRPPYDYNDLSALLTNLGRENLGHTLP
jgi:hypothetical protein